MLYRTTRSTDLCETAHRALCASRAPDGGVYLPLRFPQIAREKLHTCPPGAWMAEILNLFFPAKLAEQTLSLLMGRRPIRLTALHHRITAAECWHTPERSLSQTVSRLSVYLGGPEAASSWTRIAVRIGVLFWIFSELDAESDVDVALPGGDLTDGMAAWYAREMGLPIGTIVCAAESGVLWELVNHGELHTDTALPAELERLIEAAFGTEETARYLDALRCGGCYRPPADRLEQLREGFYAAVVSQDRQRSLSRLASRPGAYPFDADSALAFAGLQDFRTHSGERRSALLLCERSAVQECAEDTPL